jgi:FixJ family two-component response regulator
MLAGEATSAIAARLALSERVIEIHRANLMAKFGVASLLELIPKAMEQSQ